MASRQQSLQASNNSGVDAAIWRSVLLVAILAFAGAPGAAQSCEAGAAAIPESVRNIDVRGDIHLDSGRVLRLAGIAWPPPERQAARKALAAQVADLVLKTTVIVDAVDRPDRWGRVSAQVYAGRDWLQGRLVEDGLALAWPEPAARPCWADLLERDMLARDGKYGVWSPLHRRAGRVRAHGRAAGGMARRVIFEGTVRSVRKGRSVTFVNFIGPRAKTPSWFVSRRLMGEFSRLGRDIATFSGKRLRVRAELVTLPTLRLTVNAPEGIEILD